MRPRLAFFGSPEFAVPALDAATRVGDVVVVVTQPDAPAGRGQQLRFPPVKRRALEKNLPVLQPERLRNESFLEAFRAVRPDAAILAAYGKILPQAVLEIPRLGFVNIHPSLLPKYRGAAPVAGAILDGATETGVTLMLLDREMDHGPILAQLPVAINNDEHRPNLETRLANLGAGLLEQRLPDFVNGRLKPQPQDHANATYTEMLQRKDSRIDWSTDAELLARRVRALDPWPGTSTTWNGQPLKILEARAVRQTPTGTLGQVATIADTPAITCGQGALILTKIQLAGGKAVSGSDFVRGHPTFIGSRLG